MEEENFMFSCIAAAFGVLPILFFSIIACERKKKSRRALPPSSYRQPSSSSKSSVFKEASSRQELQNETSTTTTIQRPSTSYECTECQRFDDSLNTALKETSRIKIVNTDGRCCINEHEIIPKKCQHGNVPNIITINRPELQMSTFIGNGTVLKICDGCINIISTNMGKANVMIGGNCSNIIGDGNVMIGGGNYTSFDCGNNVTYINGNRYGSSTSVVSKAIECLECCKYDEQVAATSKSTIIRDSRGTMLIISSTGMDIIKQNGQTFINGNEIISKNCNHGDINRCSVYFSSNLKGIKNSSIYYSTTITGNNNSIYHSSNVSGSGCSIYNSSNVNGKNCSIYNSSNVNAIGSSIYSSSNVNGNKCTIYSSSTINTNNCTLYSCSTVYTDNCVKYSCTNVNGKRASGVNKSEHDMGIFDTTDFDREIEGI